MRFRGLEAFRGHLVYRSKQQSQHLRRTAMGITGRSPGESTPAVRTALVRPLDLARGGPMTNSSSSDKARLSGFWICAALVLGVFTTTARPRSDVVVAKSAANVRYDVRDLGPLPWVADDVLPNI